MNGALKIVKGCNFKKSSYLHFFTLPRKNKLTAHMVGRTLEEGTILRYDIILKFLLRFFLHKYVQRVKPNQLSF